MLSRVSWKSFSTQANQQFKVAILGAGGGIGQPLSLLLREQPAISHLSLYDIAPSVPGITADLSHCSVSAKISGHVGDEQLPDALKGSDIVVIPAGVPRKPGMTRDDLFNVNASIVYNLAKNIGKHCPKAHVLIISNPVNSTVPIAAETLKRLGVYDPKRYLQIARVNLRLYGITYLDVVRANKFVGDLKAVKPEQLHVSVIGGHSGVTIVPLFSQLQGLKLTQQEIEALTKRVQFGGDEVVKAKAGAGSATLSMAYAAREFIAQFFKGLRGEKVILPAFVDSKVTPAPFFASNVEITSQGISNVHGFGSLSDYEKSLVELALPELLKNIESGVNFVKNQK